MLYIRVKKSCIRVKNLWKYFNGYVELLRYFKAFFILFFWKRRKEVKKRYNLVKKMSQNSSCFSRLDIVIVRRRIYIFINFNGNICLLRNTSTTITCLKGCGHVSLPYHSRRKVTKCNQIWLLLSVHG